MARKLIEALRSFPPLLESIQEINRICAHKDTNINALVAVIENDPVLYADLLRSVNAPFYAFKSEIKSIHQAISLFGVSMIRGFALAIAIKKHSYTDMSYYSVSNLQWIQTMQKQQQFLYLWLSKEDPIAQNILGATSFMLEIGKLVFCYALNYSHLDYSIEEKVPFKAQMQEKKLLGSSSDELTSELFDLWHYEEEFVNLLRYSLAPKDAHTPKLAAMLCIARNLITIHGVQSLEDIDTLIKEYGFNKTLIEEAYNSLV